MPSKKTDEAAAAGYRDLNETVSDAVRAISAQAVNAAADGVESFNSEVTKAVDAAGNLGKAKSAEEAFRIGADYLTAFAGRASDRVKAAVESFPKAAAETAAPVEAVARSFQSSFFQR